MSMSAVCSKEDCGGAVRLAPQSFSRLLQVWEDDWLAYKKKGNSKPLEYTLWEPTPDLTEEAIAELEADVSSEPLDEHAHGGPCELCKRTKREARADAAAGAGVGAAAGAAAGVAG